jgi:hypothetical protein
MMVENWRWHGASATTVHAKQQPHTVELSGCVWDKYTTPPQDITLHQKACAWLMQMLLARLP